MLGKRLAELERERERDRKRERERETVDRKPHWETGVYTEVEARR